MSWKHGCIQWNPLPHLKTSPLSYFFSQINILLKWLSVDLKNKIDGIIFLWEFLVFLIFPKNNLNIRAD